MKKKPIKNTEVIDYEKCWVEFKNLVKSLILLSDSGEKIKIIETMMKKLEKENTTFKVEQ